MTKCTHTIINGVCNFCGPEGPTVTTFGTIRRGLIWCDTHKYSGKMCPQCFDEKEIYRLKSENERLKAEAAGMRRLALEISTWHSFCPECGSNIGVDEDALCGSCGATCTGAALDALRARAERLISGSAGKELLERRTEELGETYSRGHRDARLAIDKILNDPGKGSMGDIEFSIKALIKERDELKAKLESAEQRAAKAEKACAEMWRALLTHCERGHEFTPGNTYRDGEGRRRCIQCRRE